VKDLHWNSAKFLASSYSTIIIPHFRTAELLKGKKLPKQTKRQLQALSFFSFKERLAHKCSKYGTKVLLVEEDYTSKTCGNCGNINYELGGAKLFQCSSCQVTLDRDENGARNILLKQIPILQRYASRDSDYSEL
jgi:putative transposase